LQVIIDNLPVYFKKGVLGKFELFNDNPITSPTANNITPPTQYNITVNTGDINGTSGEEIGEGLAKQLMHQENSIHNSIESGAVR